MRVWGAQTVGRRRTLTLVLSLSPSPRPSPSPHLIQTLDDPELAELIGDAELYDALIEEVEMLKELTPEIDMAAVGRGEMTPVFFGSAMTNFGAPSILRPQLQHRLLHP